ALDELAGGVAREVGVEGDLPRRLVVGEVAAAEFHHLGRRHRRTGAGLHGRVHALTPLGVGDAEHGGVLDGGVPVQHVLDLGRLDVDAARDDHVALAIADVDEALVVHPRHVADAQPFAAGGLLGGGRVLVVPVEDAVVAAHVQLAGPTAPQRTAAGV